MADDSFEAARKAFFRTEKATPEEKAFADKVVKPQNAPIVDESSPANFGNEHEASQP